MALCPTKAYPSGISSTQKLLGTIDHLGIGFGTLPTFHAAGLIYFFFAVWKLVDGRCMLLFCSSDTELLAAISSFNNNNYNQSAPTLNCSNKLTVNVMNENEIIVAKV